MGHRLSSRLPQLLLCLVVLAAESPTFARAAGFTAPQRIPGGNWQFAVNDRGEAVGAHGTAGGAVVVQLNPAGRVWRSWRVPVPGQVEEAAVSVALSDGGLVALGISYWDGQVEPSHEEHGGPGCCQHIAIASWRLGARPAPVQNVSPALTPRMIYNDWGDQPFVPPQMVISGSTVTAIWVRGSQGEEREPGEAQIEEAFGRIDAGLHTAKLLSVPAGVSFLDLHLMPDHRPVASWVDDRDIVRTATGLRSGALGSPARPQLIRSLVGEDGSGVGFAHDDEGDTIFAYLTGTLQTTQRLVMITSTTGGPFVRRRIVATIPPESGEVGLYAGGYRSILAIWRQMGRNFAEHFKARRGSVFGPFDETTEVDTTEFPYQEATGFIDSRGRSFIMHRVAAARRPNKFELEAFLAQPDRAFDHSLRVAPGLRNCGLEASQELGIEPIPTSSNGRAVFYLTCEEGSGRNGDQYVIRYTP